MAFERKYYNIDIDAIHKRNQFLQSKLELCRWKITEFIAKYGDKIPAYEHFDSPLFRMLDKAIDEGEIFDPANIANMVGDNLLQQQNKSHFDQKLQREDYEKAINKQNGVLEAEF